ncbi:T3SS effector HopA1 family protein [Streptomyces sp. NPDC127033]|uniref:T3SS effector HopA1 family protein n=1 Tax=Streptomyces sp. NPDC127033 TaxID=3347110 RepID=UPI00365A5860
MHAPSRWHDGSFSSDRQEYALMISEAERLLGDLTYERPGFTVVSQDGSGRTVAFCPDGVDVVFDVGQARAAPSAPSLAPGPVRGSEPRPGAGPSGRITLTAGAVAAPVGARWIYWSPPDAPSPVDARVYVHARPETALQAWSRLVRALHASGIACAAKIGGSAAMLDRPDCVVFYCSASDLGAVAELAAEICPDRSPGVPGFGLAPYPGVGVVLAPEAGTGQVAGSVGYYWAGALADAWATSGAEGLEPVYERLARSWTRTRRCLRTSEEQ